MTSVVPPAGRTGTSGLTGLNTNSTFSNTSGNGTDTGTGTSSSGTTIGPTIRFHPANGHRTPKSNKMTKSEEQSASSSPSADGDNNETSSPPKKRRKTSRACNHCQKAHVTCDSGRPCQRCVKKGLQDSCQDGVRKKAKYLADDDGYDGMAFNQSPNSTTSLLPSLSNSLPLTPPDNTLVKNNTTSEFQQRPSIASIINGDGPHPTAIPPNLVEDPTFLHSEISPYSFGSRATNLEYSILSNILRTSLETPQHLQQIAGPGSTSQTAGSTPESDISLQGTYFPEVKISDFALSQSDNSYNNIDNNINSNNNNDIGRDDSSISGGSGPRSSPDLQSEVAPHRWNSPEEVYQYVRSPFPYTQGFHALIAYLRARFDKRHLMHMARAMAAYRPSFIATTKRLKEADLIFMEQCFQRTLMEFEKIIASSGTPTIIWRRTGQIAAVGKEFCILTGWSPERLVSNTTFIVELMDDKSVTDYFDVFSKLAFGDSRGVSMTECTLLKPNGDPVPTACTWTVKRDVFDIPMMIIGNVSSRSYSRLID